MFYFLCFWIATIPLRSCFYYRARGGAISLGDSMTQLARILFWGIPIGIECTAIAAFQDMPLWLGACCAVTAWISAIIGHSSEQTNTIESFEGMSMITTIMAYIIVSPFLIYIGWTGYFHEYKAFIFAPLLGALSGFCYWQGYKRTEYLNLFKIKWCVPGDVSWGEFFTGAAFGIFLVLIGLCK